jgi:DNA gyrase subunit A
MRCPVNNIRETNRGSKGVKLVNLNEKDKLIAVSEVVELNEEDSEKNTEPETDVAVHETLEETEQTLDDSSTE